MPLPNSLFDNASVWLADPVEAYSAYLGRPDAAVAKSGQPRALRSSSVEIYQHRFGKFVRECLDGPAPTPDHPHHKTLATLSTDDVELFLAPMSPSSRHCYVRMLERVLDHMIQLGLRTENPARELGIRRPVRSGQAQLPTQLLTLAQQGALLAAMPEPTNWKHLRSRAIISLALGGGLRISELQSCTVDQIGRIEDDGTLPVELRATGAGRRHRTRVQVFAVQPVLAYLRQRATMPIPGNLLFPADAATGRPLSKTGIYRLCRRTLAKAGIPLDELKRRGPRVLRSSFAVRSLAAGGAPQALALLGEQMGHRSDRATRHYSQLARTARQLSL